MSALEKHTSLDRTFVSAFFQAEERWEHFFSKSRIAAKKIDYERLEASKLLIYAKALSRGMREAMVRSYGENGVNRLVYGLAKNAGAIDARKILNAHEVLDPISGLVMGKVLLKTIGWSQITFSPECIIEENDENYIICEHNFSFEANCYIDAQLVTNLPICHLSCGYYCGWSEISLKSSLAARELDCLAKGDDRCIIVMAPPYRLFDWIKETKAKYGIK